MACVAINGGENSAWLAGRILAVEDDELSARLDAESAKMAEKVVQKDNDIRAKYSQQ